MSFLDEILDVTVTATTRTPTRAGFGTAMIAAYHTHFAERSRTYTSLAGMVTDGFTTTEPAYEMATAIFAQNPSPTRVKVGRRALAFSQIVDLFPEASVDLGDVFSVAINGTTVTYTAILYDTTSTVCTALAALIDALPLVTATAVAGTHVRVLTTLAGSLARYASLTDTLTLLDSTADPGIATDLAAILAYDADWYGLLLDSNSAAEITAAATWVEAAKKIFAAQSADGLCLSAGSTTDIMYTTEAAGFARTFVLYYPAIRSALGWIAAALVGLRFPTDPGTENWAWGTLAGVTVYSLTDTQRAAVRAKNGNYYVLIDADNPITWEGTMASGQWIDEVRGIDALTARIREDQLALRLAQPNGKLPFTANGIDLVGAALKGSVKAFTTTPTTPRLLDSSPAPSIFTPAIEDVSSADRAARTLPGVTFSAKLSGAINAGEVTGTVYA